MSDYNFGDKGFWDFVLFLAVAGIVGIITGLIVGVIWLVNHISISIQ